MLTLDVERSGDVAVLRCSGRIVRGEGLSALRAAVISEKESRIVVLDLSEVDTLDAGGLTALLSLHHWARNRGVQLKLVNPTRFVKQMFERTGLDYVFEISSLGDALLVLSGGDCQHARYAARC
jgi:anti-anti-sigma factor